MAGKNQADLWKTRTPGMPEEAYLAVLRTADDLQAAVSGLLKHYGLSPTQYTALRILRGAGEDGLPCSQVGERMIHRDPDITRLLDRLEARGLIARSRGKQDRRKIFARISHAGLVLLRKLDQPVEDFIRQLLGGVEENQLRSAIRFLDDLRSRAQTGG